MFHTSLRLKEAAIEAGIAWKLTGKYVYWFKYQWALNLFCIHLLVFKMVSK